MDEHDFANYTDKNHVMDASVIHPLQRLLDFWNDKTLYKVFMQNLREQFQNKKILKTN